MMSGADRYVASAKPDKGGLELSAALPESGWTRLKFAFRLIVGAKLIAMAMSVLQADPELLRGFVIIVRRLDNQVQSYRDKVRSL